MRRNGHFKLDDKRILVLGTTGIDKRKALHNISNWYQDDPPWEPAINFEKDYLFNPAKKGLRRNTFLDASLETQFNTWANAWDVFAKEKKLTKKGNRGTRGMLLSMHGVYLRGHYGTRSVLLPTLIAKQFKPDIIITLIADAYNSWWTTEAFAEGDALLGRPTLEDLVIGRRQEILVGDLIALACRPDPVRNVMLSASHPVECVAHCIDNPDPRVVYLSFPISEPRRMRYTKEPKSDSGMSEVSDFVRAAFAHQHKHPDLVVECPLMIDELPLRELIMTEGERVFDDGYYSRYKTMKKLASDDTEEVPHVFFPRDVYRWPLGDMCDLRDCIVPPTDKEQLAFPVAQIVNAAGNIYTDVTLRDYRYVDQAECLAVYNPVFNSDREGISGSVQQEIDHAIKSDRRVFVYQDPARDKTNAVGKQFGQPNATMRADPGKTRKFRAASPEQLLEAISSYKRD